MRFAVIIPALNEADQIGGAIASAAGAHVILADGGSTDETAAIAQRAGASVVVETGGRGRQANAGAAAAIALGATALLFLHADSQLPPDWMPAAIRALDQPDVALGAFSLRIADARVQERVVAAGANLRSRLLRLPYGDQALFLRQDMFGALGGFRALPIMEDFDLVRRAGRIGRVLTLPQRVTTSPRRWRRMGTLRSVALNQAMLAGWSLGIAPDRLARLYRRTR